MYTCVVHADIIEDDDNVAIYREMNGVLQYVADLLSSHVPTLKNNTMVYAYVL